MNNNPAKTAHYHLPGLFEFYELYQIFLKLRLQHPEYFYDWCDIGSIYGSPQDCIWAGGRVETGTCQPQEVLDLMNEYGISARLTLSNSLLKKEHLSDKKCSDLCALFSENSKKAAGAIIHSDLLLDHLKAKFPRLYLVSSTTKVLEEFDQLLNELDNPDFLYVVPDFRLNKAFDRLDSLSQPQKDKTEFLCNECCSVSCRARKACYEDVSYKNLGIDHPQHICTSPDGNEGYRFSKAMASPAFISIEDIQHVYMPMGFSNFKIEGRGLGSAMVLEFLIYYMVRPQYQIHVREEIYLDGMLDLF